MSLAVEELAQEVGVEFTDYQVEALEWAWNTIEDTARTCLYYKTGAGKSITALAMLRLWKYREAVVITPPSTFPQWMRFAEMFDMVIKCMSHAKFRQPDTKLSRYVPVIADEMHMFGGHSGKGWVKLDRLARHLEAPVILASATPNYNDAERVYCIKHILDPHGTKGGFLEFVYAECDTEQNPFGMQPRVTGFKNYGTAAEYLAALPGVHYLKDDLVFQVMDSTVPDMTPTSRTRFGYNEREHRIMASIIEEKHVRIFQNLVAPSGLVYDHVYTQVEDLVVNAETPVLVFCAHATVAVALARTFEKHRVAHGLITGAQTAKAKEDVLRRFLMQQFDVLVGTASLATGTDGIDKVCDTLIILDDTEDDAMRRQLIGRIMPRGLDSDASGKYVYRVLQQ